MFVFTIIHPLDFSCVYSSSIRFHSILFYFGKHIMFVMVWKNNKNIVSFGRMKALVVTSNQVYDLIFNGDEEKLLHNKLACSPYFSCRIWSCWRKFRRWKDPLRVNKIRMTANFLLLLLLFSMWILGCQTYVTVLPVKKCYGYPFQNKN